MKYKNFKSEFLTRSLSSIILIIISIFILFFGDMAVKLMIVFLSGLTFFELENLSNSKKKLFKLIPFVFISYILLSDFSNTNIDQFFGLLILFVINSIIIFVFLFKKSLNHFLFIGLLLNNLFVSILFFLTDENYNFKTIFFIILIICTCDTFSYLCGKKFGSVKIIPKISPNKTLEGYIGGIVFSTCFAIIISKAYGFIILDMIIFSIIICILAIAGGYIFHISKDY